MNKDNEDTIVLKNFNNEMEAELLTERLKSQSIFAFIKRDDPSTMGIHRGAKVLICKKDKEQALEILKALKV